MKIEHRQNAEGTQTEYRRRQKKNICRWLTAYPRQIEHSLQLSSESFSKQIQHCNFSNKDHINYIQWYISSILLLSHIIIIYVKRIDQEQERPMRVHNDTTPVSALSITDCVDWGELILFLFLLRVAGSSAVGNLIKCLFAWGTLTM